MLRPCYTLPLFLWIPLAGLMTLIYATQDAGNAWGLAELLKHIGWSGVAVWLFFRVPVWGGRLGHRSEAEERTSVEVATFGRSQRRWIARVQLVEGSDAACDY